MKARHFFPVASAALGVFLGSSCWANVSESTANSFGNVGLSQVPTARFRGAGWLHAGYASSRPYDSTFFSANPYDWLEATLRYTKFRYGDQDGVFREDGYLDKSFDFKLRIAKERYLFPEIAFGIQDLGGTGLLASEYFVASKRLRYGLDFTVGVAWGRLGARGTLKNPLSDLSSSFSDRNRGDVSTAGGLSLDRLFSGEEFDVFAGLSWTPPGSRFSFSVEREGNDYSLEPFGNNLDVRTPVNVSASYFGSSYGVRVGWERGDQFVFGVQFGLDLSQPGPAKTLDAPPSPVAPTWTSITPIFDNSVTTNPGDRRAAISSALRRQQISLLKLEFHEGSDLLTAWVADNVYRNPGRAIGRVARTLAMLAPEAVERVRVVTVQNGLEQTRVVVLRSHVRYATGGEGVPTDALKWAEFTAPAEDPIDIERTIGWWAGPRYRQSLGDPDQSYRGQLFWQLGATAQLTPYLNAVIAGEVSLAGNIDEIEREPITLLPRVRSDIAEYYRQGATGLRRLELNYVHPFSSVLFGRVSAGIFEDMYGGIATEVLYRPFASSWALGAGVNRVRQREFDQRLKFRDYEVTTGHLTAYHRYYPLSIQSTVSVGRYLAGDIGGTVVLEKVFRTGVRMGVFATKTDVSSEEFGEGSFDKGFLLTIPLDSLLPKSSKVASELTFKPLTRDGGQKVRDGMSLYDTTMERDYLRLVRGGYEFGR